MLKTLWVISFIICLTQTTLAKELLHYIGYAYEKNTNQLLYTDEYEEFNKNNSIQATATYKDANQNIIAKKTIYYNDNFSLPSFLFNHYENNMMISVNVSTTIEVVYQPKNSKYQKKASITYPKNAIMDAGFHYFIQQHWNQIIQYKIIPIHYVSPTKKRTFKFTLKMISKEQWNNQDTALIQLKPTSFLLNIFLDPIILRYNIHTKQLLTYSGLSNIEINSKKKNIYMVINYL